MRSTVFCCTNRVQCRKYKLAGLRGSKRRVDGGKVAHFTQQNNVGGLPQSAAQRIGIAVGVVAHFTLADDALLVGMQILDGVLDGDDVAFAGGGDAVDDTGKRSGFSASSRAGHQHQALLFVGKFHHRFGNIQFTIVG